MKKSNNNNSILYTHKKIRECLYIITIFDVFLHVILAFLSSIYKMDTVFAYCLITGLLQVFPAIFLKDVGNHRFVTGFQFLEISILSVFLNLFIQLPASIFLIFSILPIFSFIWFQYKSSHFFKTKKGFIIFFSLYSFCTLITLAFNINFFSRIESYSLSPFIKWASLTCFVFAFFTFVFECYFLAHVARSLRTITETSIEDSVAYFLTLINTVEAKDPYTKGHSQRVADYSLKIAKELGFSPKAQETLKKAALLHDIGKIGISDTILKKNGGLTPSERSNMNLHSQIGANILSDIKKHKEYMIVAGQHHEKWDGTGYPNGLSHNRIHKFSQIVSVADAYDAMTSNRTYIPTPKTQAQVRQEFVNGSGQQFSPKIAAIMIKLIDNDPSFKMKA